MTLIKRWLQFGQRVPVIFETAGVVVEAGTNSADVRALGLTHQSNGEPVVIVAPSVDATVGQCCRVQGRCTATDFRLTFKPQTAETDAP